MSIINCIHKTSLVIDMKLVHVHASYHIASTDDGEDYPEIDDIEPVFIEDRLNLKKYIDEHFQELAEMIAEKMEYDL